MLLIGLNLNPDNVNYSSSNFPLLHDSSESNDTHAYLVKLAYLSGSLIEND
jgi:hypothetical protein